RECRAREPCCYGFHFYPFSNEIHLTYRRFIGAVIRVYWMKTHSFTLHISDSIGDVSANLMQPDDMTAMLTFAHGAGAGMHHKFMTELASALAIEGIGTLRFNFPYMEQKKKRPDVPAVAHATIAAALQYVQQLFPNIPVFASGKSFGGRMSSQWLALQPNGFVKGIIF